MDYLKMFEQVTDANSKKENNSDNKEITTEKVVEKAEVKTEQVASNENNSSKEFDFNKLSEMLGVKYNSVDELKSALNPKEKEVTEEVILGKLSEMLGSKVDNFNNVKERYDAYDYLQDEDVLKVVGAKKSGLNVDDFVKLQNLDVAKMNDLDKVVQMYLMKNPKLKEEKVREELTRKFDWDEENKEGNIELAISATDAEKYLSELKSKVLPFDLKKDKEKKIAEYNAQIETLKKGWNSVLPKFEESYKDGLKLFTEKDGKPVEIHSVPFTDEMKSKLKSYSDDFQKMIEKTPVPLDEKSVKQVFDHFYNQLILDNMPIIIDTVAEKIRLETEKKYHNSGTSNKDTDKTEKTTNTLEQTITQALKQMGIKK